MRLVPSLLVFAIAAGVVPDAAAGQKARPDPVASVASVASVVSARGLCVASVASVASAPVTAQAKYDAVFSICESMVPVGHSDFSALNNVTIDGAAMVYFQARGITLNESEPSVVTLLEGPQHGEMQSIFYYPNKGYLGPDQMTFSVEVKGKVFKVIYSVYVNRSSEYVAPECGNNYNIKELPNNTYNGGKGSLLNILELPISGTLDTEAFAKLHAMVSFSMGAGLPGSLLNVADLPGTAVGQTTGTSITLDTNAAGYNWFIDTTPADNSEFLPTSTNPNEWVDK